MIAELEKAKQYMLENTEGLFNHHKGFKDFEVSDIFLILTHSVIVLKIFDFSPLNSLKNKS